MSLTSPLGLMRHVRRPDIRLDVVPWLNVITVAWLLTLLQSHYIYAPGLAVDVDATGKPTPGSPTKANYPLPASIVTAGQSLPAHRFDVQLSLANQPPSTRIEQRQFFLADGTPHYSSLPAALQKAAANTHKPPGEKPTLLLFAPANTPMDTFMKLSEIASAAGFGTVLLASRPATDTDATSPNSTDKISHPEQTPPAASDTGTAK